MRGLLWWPWLSAAACSFTPAPEASDAGTPTLDAGHHDAARADVPATDAPRSDAATDGGPAGQCFTALDGRLIVCLAGAPSGSNSVATMLYDTSITGGACAALTAASDPACAIAGSDVVIPAGVVVSASGDAPLVVIATGTIDVEGTIDVASHRSGPLAGQVGAMANPASCPTGTPPAASSSGGGAGGSYATAGGNGGNGGPTPPDDHGDASGAIALAVQGGCPGQAGNTTHGGATGGAGGGGGGVVVLIAAQIHLGASGVVDASGEGGALAGSGNTRGGGGGGAGGLIGLEADTIVADTGAQVFANGGGGGGGTETNPGDTDGSDPSSATTPPAGGSPSGDAGAGGTGFYTTGFGVATAPTAGADGTNGTDGGGGGGGGAGFVHAPAAATVSGSGSISPAPTH